MTEHKKSRPVITPHPASPTSVETFLAMLLENYSDAESVVVSVVDKTGTHRGFSTRGSMRTSDLTFHRWCTNDYIDNCIKNRQGWEPEEEPKKA